MQPSHRLANRTKRIRRIDHHPIRALPHTCASRGAAHFPKVDIARLNAQAIQANESKLPEWPGAAVFFIAGRSSKLYFKLH
jgi:hypothetical protein